MMFHRSKIHFNSKYTIKDTLNTYVIKEL